MKFKAHVWLVLHHTLNHFLIMIVTTSTNKMLSYCSLLGEEDAVYRYKGMEASKIDEANLFINEENLLKQEKI